MIARMLLRCQSSVQVLSSVDSSKFRLRGSQCISNNLQNMSIGAIKEQPMPALILSSSSMYQKNQLRILTENLFIELICCMDLFAPVLINYAENFNRVANLGHTYLAL